MLTRPHPARPALLLAAGLLACRFDATGLGDAGDGDGGATSQGPGSTHAALSTGGDTGSGSATGAPPLPQCGDGELDPGEACDAGPDNPGGLACTPGCAMNTCGDGYVGAGEQCDGAAVGDRSCTPACTLNVCGDGVVGDAEQCDAAGANSDAGACTSACRLARCGDGLVGPGEACDDGNPSNSDGCVGTC